MKKTLFRMKQAVSILLAVMIVTVSLPQTGISASASESMAVENTVSDDAAAEGTDTENSDTEDAGSEDAGAEEYDKDDADADSDGEDVDDDTQETDMENSDSEAPGVESGVNTESDIETVGKNYLIDDTLGYTLTDVNMKPGSYSAQFTAKLKEYVYFNRLAVIYTTDKELADDFFPDVTYIAGDSLSGGSGDGFQVQYMTNFSQDYERDSDGIIYTYTADFVGDSALTPDTVYYYRIVYFDSSKYYFLTVPEQFTTGSPIENSSVKITALEAETVGYHAVKVVWTEENPNDEYVKTRYLKNIDTGRINTPNVYTDEDGFTVPGKYYVILRQQNGTLNFQPVLTVYTGEGELTTISSDAPLEVNLRDINDAEITIDPVPGYRSFQSKVQISPWYEITIGNGFVTTGDEFTIGMFYRIQGETSWTAAPVAYITSENTTVTLCSTLSPGTTYEYYIKLSEDYFLNTCFYSYGSEDAPRTFSTKEIESYEDSQFPDDVLRRYIKNKIGISDEEEITGDKLEGLSEISLARYSTSDPVVQSLEGIQYIPHLTRLRLYNQAVTDADIISCLTDLKEIDLSYNELTSLPDLSVMRDLKTADFSNNKITSGFVEEKLPAAFLEANPSWLSNTANSQRIPAQTPSQSQIKAMYAKLPWSTDVANTYAVNPSKTKPFAAGRLSDASLNNALNLMNFVRYTAGISSDVTLNDAYIELTQAGALVMAVNGEMTHYPEKPSVDGFPDDLYNMGYKGCGSSNIAWGFSNLAGSILGGWMNDGDSSNIGSAGHRRWVLNPSMSATGFGAVGIYSAMYSFDRSAGTTISDFVAWPARNMPTELGFGYDYPWTVSLGTDYYIPDRSKVSVTLKNIATGKTWTLNSTTSNSNGKYFSINSGGYGQGACIIFRPNTSEVSYSAGTQFEVNITGLQDKAGNDKELKYTVDFFSLGQIQSASISLNKSTLKLAPGESETLTATTKSVDEDDTTVTWSSSNPAVATVDETGKVTAVAPGDAVITAAFQGKQATCKVLVRDYSLSRTELDFDLADGTGTESLTVSDGVSTVNDVTWSSDNEAVASVTKTGSSGVVTPRGSGTTLIRAQVKDGPVLVCTVTVTNNVLTSISLDLQECTLELGVSRQLKLYFVPDDTTLSTEAVWSSDHPEIVSVDNTGMVTALAKGTAVVTAAVGELEAKCTVTVVATASPDPENIPEGLCALTNVQKMLSDVSLEGYEGWEWEDGDIPLAQFAGMQKKSFAAVYHEEGYADYKTTLEVSLATLTGISVVADRTILKQNDEMRVNILWKMSGSESIMSAYADDLKWESSNLAVVTVGSTDDTALAGTVAVLKAGTTLGSAKITAQIALGDKNYKASCKVTVVDRTTAEFKNLSVEGFTQISQNSDSPVSYEGMLESQAGTIRVAVTNTSKLTVKSNSTKVVSVGKARLEEGVYQIPLTLKSAGVARITLTANDAAKSTMDILLYVKDAKPNLSQNTVTVNKMQTTGTVFYIYPNDGYSVSGYELVGDNAYRFESLKRGVESDGYVIKCGKDTLKGSYKLSVKVTITEEKPSETGQAAASFVYELPLTVKVTEQLPKYKITQSAKANLFYRDLGTPQLIVTSEESLNELILTGCDFKLTEIQKGVSYRISPDVEGGLPASSNNKGTLQLTFEGYETIYVPYTVKVENKKPKLSLDNKAVVFYPNAEISSAVINVKSGGEYMAPGSFSAVLKKSGFELSQTENGLILSGGDLSTAATIKEDMEITCDNWTAAIPLSLTIKVNMGKPTVKLKNTVLQLNTDTTVVPYDMAGTEIMWKDGAYFSPDNRLSVSAANDKAQEVIHDGIVFEQAGNQVIARLNNQNVATGSYKFKVQVIGVPNTSATLTVKVVNTDMSKAVKLSTKGSIDVLNREGSCVTVTPTLKAVNGDLTGVKLSGKFAHLFTAKINEKNKIEIYARESDEYGRDVALITKYPYSVNLVFTITNAKGETIQLTTGEIKLKLKQGKPKMTAAPKSAVFYSGAYNAMKLDISATLKNAADPEIKNVELINYTDLFDYSDGTLTRLYTGAAVKGKTYKLQFRITFRDQADNEKAVIVKYNVKIK